MSLATEAIEAQIQKNVGEFLTLKAKLVKMKASRSPAIQTRANELYTEQVKLEGDLTDALARIENIKKGAYTFSDTSRIATFVMDLKSHMKETKSFLAGKKEPAILGGMVTTPIIAGLGILALVWFIRR